MPVPSVSGFKFSHQKMADGSWSFFEEDEVCRKTADGSFMYGFVVKNSTYQSSDEEEDDEDRLEKGKVRVSWHPSGKESVVSENQVWNVDTLWNSLRTLIGEETRYLWLCRWRQCNTFWLISCLMISPTIYLPIIHSIALQFVNVRNTEKYLKVLYNATLLID